MLDIRRNITKGIAKECGIFEGVAITHFDISINNETGEKKRIHTRKGKVMDCFQHLFRVQWDKGGWMECFLYSDLRSGSFKINEVKENGKKHYAS